MNAKNIFAVALVLSLVPGASAKNKMLVPMATVIAEAPAAAAEDDNAVVLLEEDFGKMIAGSETNPDNEYIADKTTGSIPSQYTRLPGWSGACIYQAGGTCAILTGKFSDGTGGYTEETGFLRTPQGAYAGNVTLTFRARLFESSKSTDKMDIALLNSNGRLESTTADIDTEWKTFTIKLTKGEFSGCLIQLSMISEKVLIDDIKVTAVQTSIPAPLATEATDFTADGFTAHWEECEQADSYMLTIYEKKVEDAVIIQDFEGLNIIDGTNKLDADNPGFDEGWTVAYGLTRNADHVSNLGYEGTTGMVFRTTGEGFITPTFDRPILDFSFYAAHPSGEGCLSTLVVSVLVDGEWGALGNYDVERISRDGEIIRLSSNFPEGVKAVKVYFRKNDMYDAGIDVSVVIDHIRIMTDPEAIPAISNIRTGELSYRVSGLDPEKDYSYTVKSVNSMFTSSESNEITALGLAAPVLLPGSNISEGTYTANWEKTPKADGYEVSNYRVYTVNAATENVAILHETFDKVTVGTFDNPEGLYNMVYPRYLDEYTENPGWLGLATYLVNGMIGTRSYMVIQGIIQTPLLNLSGNNGRFRVHVRVVGDSDATNEMLVVQAGMSSYQRAAIKASEPVELDFVFNGGTQQMALAFYSYNGYPFYLDEVTVTQDLPAGTEVFYEVENREIEGGDVLTTTFNNLKVGQYESYAYRVFAYRDFMGDRIYSLSYNAEGVSLPSGVEAVVVENHEALTRYYRLDGIETIGRPSTPGIYIRRTGNKAEKIVVK